MDNIVLIGLIYDENLGDQAIALSTKQMVKNLLFKIILNGKSGFLIYMEGTVFLLLIILE